MIGFRTEEPVVARIQVWYSAVTEAVTDVVGAGVGVVATRCTGYVEAGLRDLVAGISALAPGVAWVTGVDATAGRTTRVLAVAEDPIVTRRSQAVETPAALPMTGFSAVRIAVRPGAWIPATDTLAIHTDLDAVAEVAVVARGAIVQVDADWYGIAKIVRADVPVIRAHAILIAELAQIGRAHV